VTCQQRSHQPCGEMSILTVKPEALFHIPKCSPHRGINFSVFSDRFFSSVLQLLVCSETLRYIAELFSLYQGNSEFLKLECVDKITEFELAISLNFHFFPFQLLQKNLNKKRKILQRDNSEWNNKTIDFSLI
jgi:hypothetical protein